MSKLKKAIPSAPKQYHPRLIFSSLFMMSCLIVFPQISCANPKTQSLNEEHSIIHYLNNHGANISNEQVRFIAYNNFDINESPNNNNSANNECEWYDNKRYSSPVGDKGGFNISAIGIKGDHCAYSASLKTDIKSPQVVKVDGIPKARFAIEVTAKIPDTAPWFSGIWLVGHGPWPAFGELDLAEVQVQNPRDNHTAAITSSLVYGVINDPVTHTGHVNSTSNNDCTISPMETCWAWNDSTQAFKDIFKANSLLLLKDTSTTFHNYAVEVNCHDLTKGMCDVTWFLDGAPYYQIQILQGAGTLVGLEHPLDSMGNKRGESINFTGKNRLRDWAPWNQSFENNAKAMSDSLKQFIDNGFKLTINVAAQSQIKPSVGDHVNLEVSGVKYIDLYAK